MIDMIEGIDILSRPFGTLVSCCMGHGTAPYGLYRVMHVQPRWGWETREFLLGRRRRRTFLRIGRRGRGSGPSRRRNSIRAIVGGSIGNRGSGVYRRAWVLVLPGAELFGEVILDWEAVAAFGGEVDVFWPGEELFFFVFAEDAAGVLGDDLDALEGGAVAAGVGADEADVGPEGAAGAALVAVEDEPHGPLPGVIIEADFLDVTLGKGACGLVAGG